MLEPAFTFHGFQYAEVETDAELLDAAIVAISSDAPQRSTFECARHARSTGCTRTSRGRSGTTSCPCPTDCPQRDERLGWTGDAQAFAATGSTLLDAEAFWRAGCATSRSSRIRRARRAERRAGRRARRTAAVRPRRLGRRRDHRAVGRLRVVRRSRGDRGPVGQHAPLGRVAASTRRGDDGLLGRPIQFGDWLDPDAPPDEPWEAKVDCGPPRQRVLRAQRAADCDGGPAARGRGIGGSLRCVGRRRSRS